PGRTSVTPAPTDSTTPATSPPGENGGGGLNWYLPCTTSRSGKFTPQARTPTTTCPAAATGSGRSPTASESTGPYARQTSAFIACSPAERLRLRAHADA